MSTQTASYCWHAAMFFMFLTALISLFILNRNYTDLLHVTENSVMSGDNINSSSEVEIYDADTWSKEQVIAYVWMIKDSLDKNDIIIDGLHVRSTGSEKINEALFTADCYERAVTYDADHNIISVEFISY